MTFFPGWVKTKASARDHSRKTFQEPGKDIFLGIEAEEINCPMGVCVGYRKNFQQRGLCNIEIDYKEVCYREGFSFSSHFKFQRGSHTINHPLIKNLTFSLSCVG